MDSDISNCIQESSCAHSMDVGVKCLPFTDACAVPVDEVITTVEPSTTCNCCQQCTPPTLMSIIAKCTPASTGGYGNVNEVTTNNTQPLMLVQLPHNKVMELPERTVSLRAQS